MAFNRHSYIVSFLLISSLSLGKSRDPSAVCSKGFDFVSVKFFNVSGSTDDFEHSVITCKRNAISARRHKLQKRSKGKRILAGISFTSRIAPPPSPKGNEQLLCSTGYEFTSIQTVPTPGKEDQFEQYFVACRKKHTTLDSSVAEQLNQSERNWRCHVNCRCLLEGDGKEYRKRYFKAEYQICDKPMDQLFIFLNNEVCAEKCETLYSNQVIGATLTDEDPSGVLKLCQVNNQQKQCDY